MFDFCAPFSSLKTGGGQEALIHHGSSQDWRDPRAWRPLARLLSRIRILSVLLSWTPYFLCISFAWLSRLLFLRVREGLLCMDWYNTLLFIVIFIGLFELRIISLNCLFACLVTRGLRPNTVWCQYQLTKYMFLELLGWIVRSEKFRKGISCLIERLDSP